MILRIKTTEVNFELEISDTNFSHYDYVKKDYKGKIEAFKELIQKVAEESIKISSQPQNL